jgi:hypothetical protein
MNHHVTTAQPNITTQPSPPSGTCESASRDCYIMSVSEGVVERPFWLLVRAGLSSRVVFRSAREILVLVDWGLAILEECISLGV